MKNREIHHLLPVHPLITDRMGDFLCAILPLAQGGQEFTRDECIEYIANRTQNGYIRPKSVVYEGLAGHFPNVQFEETLDSLTRLDFNVTEDIDYLGDVDYLGFIGERAFGIQIKPTTAKANFGNYSVSERMKSSFARFTDEFLGKVFIVFSLDGEIANRDIIPEIAAEIERLA